MTIENIQENIAEILAKVLNTDSVELNTTTTAQDIEGWDSITNVTLISEIEKHFNIKFKLREILKFKNVGELCSSVLKKLV